MTNGAPSFADKYGRPIFFAVLGVVVFYFIVYGITGKASIVDQVQDTGRARGLITFIITMGSVGVAIILVIAAIISEGTIEEVKARLDQGRQVLTPLVGILGTIVGFYFGQASTTPASPASTVAATQQLRVTDVSLVPEEQKAGNTITVIASISGGIPPYTYSIAFTPKVVPDLVNQPSSDGKVRRDIMIPAVVTAPEAQLQVLAVDASAKNASAGPRTLKIIRP